MKTLLQLASSVATEIQVPLPNAVYGLTDPTPRRMVRYANKAVDLVARSVDWTTLRRERLATSIAGSQQTGLLPVDFSRMVPETFWNRTLGTQFVGPEPAGRWQYAAARYRNAAMPIFTIRGDDIHVLPAMTAGDELAFEYITKHVVEDADGDGKETFTHDTDKNRVDDELVILAMIADWLAAENQPFDMPLALFRQRLAKLAEQDNPTDGILHTDVPGRYSSYDIVLDRN